MSYPNSPTSTPSFMPLHIPDPSIKGVSFDQLLQNRGIRFIHRSASTCPNVTDLYDNNHDPMCTICNGNGFFFYDEKEVYGVFYSNSLEKNFEMQGVWEIGSAVVTLPVTYLDGQKTYFNTFDQLIVPDFHVRLWQRIQYTPTSNKQQKLRYPITSIQNLSSAINGVLKTYVLGIDFNIIDGNIEWIIGQEPEYDLINERGEVLSVSYLASPVYTILQHMRELRVTQEMINGQKTPIQLPHQILVRREFLVNPSSREP